MRGLLVQPLLVVARQAAACYDFEALAVQLLADGGVDAAHAACHVGNFLVHVEVLLCFEKNGWSASTPLALTADDDLPTHQTALHEMKNPMRGGRQASRFRP